MPTTFSFTMDDDTIKSQDQIRALVRKAEASVAELERLQKTLGIFGVDGDSIRLGLRDVRRRFELDQR